jgi:hypothetical protein
MVHSRVLGNLIIIQHHRHDAKPYSDSLIISSHSYHNVTSQRYQTRLKNLNLHGDSINVKLHLGREPACTAPLIRGDAENTETDPEQTLRGTTSGIWRGQRLFKIHHIPITMPKRLNITLKNLIIS